MVLGLVSLLTDLSSEMIYPLLPVFVTSVLGVGAFALGTIEAVAETTASLLKIASGYIADKTGRRKPIVVIGYSLSSLMKPLIGIATLWQEVLFFRFMDRIGKGVRTSPRDALIADVTDRTISGHAFGFHRAMDHAGAVLGPLVAVLLLKAAGLELRTVFLLAFVPGVFVVLCLLFFVKEQSTPFKKERPSRITNPDEGRVLNRNFKVFLLSIFLFTLGNSSDAFLLLRLNQEGISASGTALLWSGFHVVKMLATYTGGRLSDRIGRKNMVIIGWLYYSVIYILFAFAEGETVLISIFLAYGIYFGFTEPAERAWVARLVPDSAKGRAYGFFHAIVGIAALPASLFFGLIWERLGYHYAFLAGGVIAALASLVVSFVKDS